MTKPTFDPSYLVYEVQEIGQPRCHSMITDGRMVYCVDSTHAFAGQTVDLPIFGDLSERIWTEFDRKRKETP